MMPFDGEKFLEDQAEQLTFEGSNFRPAWSSDGQMIAFTQSICGEVSCGVWMKNLQTGELAQVSHYGSYASWNPINGKELLYRQTARESDGKQFGDSLWVYSVQTNSRLYLGRIVSPNYSNRHFNYSPNGDLIGFTSQYDNGEGIKFCTLSSNGGELNCPDIQIREFSWSPKGQIVCLSFDGTPMSETNGTLWVMEPSGDGQRPLILNDYELIE